MPPRARRRCATISIAALIAVASCAHATAKPPDEAIVPDTESRNGATIITSAVLQRSSQPLLDVMRTRLPYMQVVNGSPCPEIYLRGRSTLVTASNPAIYVDGQRATNTCVLQMLDASDLDRVEIYPSGVPKKPGYLNDPYGVILIFGRTGN